MGAGIEIPRNILGILLAAGVLTAGASMAMTVGCLALSKKYNATNGLQPRREIARKIVAALKISIGCAMTTAATQSLSGDLLGTIAWASLAIIQFFNLEKAEKSQ